MSKNIIRFQTLASTSNYIAKALEQGEFDTNSVILADFQTEGRGQRGKKWQSESQKNLTFSFVEDIEFLAPSNRFLASKAISIGIQEFLESYYGVSSMIKWPNDILVNRKKVAGILLETKNFISREFLIIGIGLNVNQDEFPNELQATSLSKELGKDLEIAEVLSALLTSLQKSWKLLLEQGGEIIDSLYFDSLVGRDETIEFLDSIQEYKGKITDVDQSGLLTVRSEKGFVRRYTNGEVKIRI